MYVMCDLSLVLTGNLDGTHGNAMNRYTIWSVAARDAPRGNPWETPPFVLGILLFPVGPRELSRTREGSHGIPWDTAVSCELRNKPHGVSWGPAGVPCVFPMVSRWDSPWQPNELHDLDISMILNNLHSISNLSKVPLCHSRKMPRGTKRCGVSGIVRRSPKVPTGFRYNSLCHWGFPWVIAGSRKNHGGGP